MSGDDDFIRGTGYLWQGQWLGYDRSSMGRVRIQKTDIVGEEENGQPGDPNYFRRIVTSVGAVWIVFDAFERPNPRIQVMPLPPEQPKRIFYLPANLPRYDEEKKDE